MTRIIEEWLPVRELSRDAAIEMAYKSIPAYIRHCRELKILEKNVSRNFYDPKIRNLHPWFARRPCSVARAITLASVISQNHKSLFMEAIGWNEKLNAFSSNRYPPLLFFTDPKRNIIEQLLKMENKKPNEITVCDPMAGGGTIPFESLRLGFKTVAIEYNPVAYLILKGTIYYPSKFGNELAKIVEEESQNLITFAQKELGDFYPKDSEGYIIARGIKCPNCSGFFPLIHDSEITRNCYLNIRFDKNAKRFETSVSKFQTGFPYKSQKRGEIICPYCHATIKKEDAYKSWTQNHTKIFEDLRNGKFNENEILSTHILLIKQTKDGYKIPDENDVKCFLNACKVLVNSFEELKDFIPLNEIPMCNDVFRPLKKHGIKYWYELFNPRQLFVLANLIKYIHERGKILLNKGELGAAVILYLSLGISRVVDYNSIATTWKRGTIRDTIGQYARGRQVNYSEEYCEAIVPYRNLSWIFEPGRVNRITQGGIIPVLSELCKRVSGFEKNLKIFQGDCRHLTSLVPEKIDVINVDPPYFDSHIYSDISEYFWQVLRLALSPVINAGYIFNDIMLNGWTPTSPNVPREGEIIVRKSGSDIHNKKFDEMWYTSQMAKFFEECFNSLKNDGILLVWFTHRSLEAWKAIINALYAGGFFVTRIWPVTSELLTRLVSGRNNNVLNKTLIIVSRKRGTEKISEVKVENHVIKLIEFMADALLKVNASETELRTFLRAAAMSGITIAPLPDEVSNPVEYCNSKLIPWSIKIADDVLLHIQKKFKNKSFRDISSLDPYL